MSRPDAHPGIDVLDRFASGALDETERRTTEHHLSTCASCRARLGELAQDLELAAELRVLAPSTAPPSPRLPDTFGEYRILREIGRGGMGIVFEAEQTNPRRRVAIKVLGAGCFAGPEAERMLRREAQALARLEHPAVARIYDVGRLDDGRPYLAMELVDGQTLTRYATETSLSRRARLLLFAELCDAVAYAHQRGVIHRDLKPSNVLVDASGRPRVLDFGLARLLDVEGEASVSLSVDTGRIRGTLAFMSPEQARGDERLVDARSDVYSLGVILYRLLLERLPYEVPSSNLPEAVRVICDEPPARPGAIDRSLRGDLETILRRALEKEPERRYATVAALREDVVRFLERQTILARSPSLAYHLGKLVQRHQLFFATVTGLFLAAIGVGVWTSALYRDADQQRDLATRSAAEKHAEATRARTLVELLQRMLGSANVHEARGADFTVRQLLDEFAGNFPAELHDQPGVEADLRETIARAYVSLGLPAEAERHVEVAIALQEKAGGPDAARIADVQEVRAWCAHEEARYEDAERGFREVLAERSRLADPADLSVGRVQYCIGDVLRHRGDAAGAEEMARASLATMDAAVRADDPNRLPTLSLLGQLLEDRGAYEEAETVLSEAVEMSIRLHGERHRNTASLRNNLGAVCVRRGEYGAAEENYGRALATRRELAHGDHPEVARVLNNLGELRRNQGKYAEAAELLRESLEMRERILPAAHPDTAQSLNNLALALYGTGDLGQAIECMRRAVAIRREAAGGADPGLPLVLVNLASLVRTRGEFDDAVALCREALAIQEKQLPADHPDTSFTLLSFGRTLREKGDLDEAEPMLRRALEIRRKRFGEGSVQVAECLVHLGYVRRDLGRPDEAAADLVGAHRVLEEKLGANDGRTLRIARDLAALYATLGQAEEAERWRQAGAR